MDTARYQDSFESAEGLASDVHVAYNLPEKLPESVSFELLRGTIGSLISFILGHQRFNLKM